MRKLLLLFISSITFFCSDAQTIIRGQILDSLTNQPIAFASIGIAGNNKGTITNEQGVFIINADSLPIKLTIFYIGYESKIIAINSNSKGELIIKLKQLTVNLKDIVVNAKNGDIIFKKAFKKLQDQKQFVYRSKSFFRLLTKNDDTCTEMIESFYDTWLCKSGIKYWELEHGRYALVKDYKEKEYAVSIDLSLLTRYIDILNIFQTEDIKYIPFVFDTKYFDHLVFNISSRFVSNENEIVKIDFYPVKKDKGKIFCNGSVYVNTKTFEVYRLVQQWSEWKNPIIHVVNPKKGIKNFKAGFDITFIPNKEHCMLINHIQSKINYDIIDINSEKLVHKVSTYSNLLFYDYANRSEDVNMIPKDEDNSSDYSQIEYRLYIKRFWDNNPVLAETPIEKNIREGFEKMGSFGKAFNNSNDTLELLKDGYKIWNKNRPLHLKDIPNKVSKSIRLDKLEMKWEGEEIGGLYSKIYFAWNCYNDSFYYVLIPLLDTKATWLSEDFRKSQQIDLIYKMYFDMVEVYYMKFSSTLKKLNQPCKKRKYIMQEYDNINKSLYDQSLEMLKDCWGGSSEDERMKGAFNWERKIDEMLEQYKE